MRGVKRKQARSAPGHIEVPPYDVVALVLQGGGALGAYQAGVYEGLHEAGIRPTWLAGISIGAHQHRGDRRQSPETQRVDRLRELWETICAAPARWPATSGLAEAACPSRGSPPGAQHRGGDAGAVPGPARLLQAALPAALAVALRRPDAATSFYDTSPLRDTLLRLVDFDRLNSGDIRVSVGAVNVRSGNFVYFDTAERKLGPEHFMASGALPPGFPAVEIEGEYYWDGGVVSNTPLPYVLSTEPRRDTPDLPGRPVVRPRAGCRTT